MYHIDSIWHSGAYLLWLPKGLGEGVIKNRALIFFFENQQNMRNIT